MQSSNGEAAEQRKVITPARLNLVVLIATTVVIVSTRFLWYRLLPLRLRVLGASDGQVALVFTVSLLLLAPTQILGGIISDRWGRRYAISIPTLLMVPALIAGALAETWLPLAALAAAVGFIGGIQQPGFNALLAESATDENRGRVFGTFFTFVSGALVIGAALGAAYLNRGSISTLIWVSVGGALVAGLIRLGFLREGNFEPHSNAQSSLGSLALLRQPMGARLGIVASLITLLVSVTQDGPFIAIHAADYLSLDDAAINQLFAFGSAAAILAAFIGGSLTDRLGGQVVAGISFFVHSSLLLGWGLWSGPEWMGQALFGLSWVAAQIGTVGYSTWLSAYAPPHMRGRVLGVVGATAALFGGLGPPAGAALRQFSL